MLIVLSGFFSGMETAFTSLGEIDLIEIEKSNSKNSKILLGLLKNKEKLLSTILIGNNIVNIAASALNAKLAILYAPILGISEAVSITLSAGGLTVIILLFGEITPKTLAIKRNIRISLLFAPIVAAFGAVISPIAYFFDRFSRFLNRLFGDKAQNNKIFIFSNIVNCGVSLYP